MMHNFYKKKNILLTGFNGFKGSWMTLMLKVLGANVYGFALDDKKNFEILNLKNYLKSYCFGNILNEKLLNQFIKKKKIDLSIHFAAESEVIKSYLAPFKAYEVNINGTLNILKIIKDRKIPCLIATSDKCYLNLNNKNQIFNENSCLGGNDVYGASKAAQEIIINPFIKTYNLKIVTSRSGNVIGGGEHNKLRIIPEIMDGIFKSGKIELRNPSHTRPWQHVLDVNYNYLKLLMKLYNDKNYSGAWNFGPSKSYSVEKIVLKFLKLNSNKKIRLIKKKNYYPGLESKFLQISSKKSKKFNFRNLYDLSKTVDITNEWYGEYYKKNKNMDLFTLNQIEKYFNEKKL